MTVRLLAGSLLIGVASAFAQGGPQARVNGLLESDVVHAGRIIYAAVEVTLPKGYHVNTNEPRNKYLVPTSLTLELPEGIALRETVYPDAIDLALDWSREPVVVFGDSFLIGVALELAEDLPLGEHVIAGRLRYQACDDQKCFRPRSVKADLELRVVGKDQESTPRNTEALESIDFGAGGSRPVAARESHRARASRRLSGDSPLSL